MLRLNRLHPPPLHLQAFVYQDPESDDYLAHCLQLDLMASGPDAFTASKNLLDVVREQIRYALENDNLEHLIHPAPPEAWGRFSQILKHGFTTTRHRIEVDVEKRNFDPQLDLAIAI
jgi:hypothetical protein